MIDLDRYCVRCDTEQTELKDGRLWCNVCWKRAKPLPTRIRALINGLAWPLGGMIWFSPAGTMPYKRAVEEGAAGLHEIGFHPPGREIRERYVK